MANTKITSKVIKDANILTAAIADAAWTTSVKNAKKAAHEVSSIVPEAVYGEKDGMRDEEYEVTPAVEEVRDADDNITTEAVDAVMGTRSVPDWQGISLTELVPLLVKTLQEQQTLIESLTARITTLEG